MLTWISLLIVVCGSPEDIALKYGDSFYDAGYYEEAITDYKRFLYFNPRSERVSYAYYKIGLAERNRRRWERSVEALRYAIELAPDDSIRNEREIALAVTLIAGGKYSSAEILLLRVGLKSGIADIRRRALFFRGIACLYRFKWESAREAFGGYFKGEPEIGAEIESLLCQAQTLTYKSPGLARWLSTFLPGLGQIYVGDWESSLNALILNGGLGSAIVYKILRADYGNAWVIYHFLFRRFYFGNRYHAGRIARGHNSRLNQWWAQRILDRLMVYE